MKITAEQHQSILDELRPERQQETDITVKIAMAEWGISKSGTRDILEKAVADGRLTKIRAVLFSGRQGILYRPVAK